MTITDKDQSLQNLTVIDTDKELPDINTPYIMRMKVDGVAYEFAGVLLAEGSSEGAAHRDHPDTPTAPKGVKCSKCRWLEVEIYKRLDTDPHEYVVITRGPSRCEGEQNYAKIEFTESAFAVAELLTVRKTRGTMNTFMPPQHALAIAQAASHDAALREVYQSVVAR